MVCLLDWNSPLRVISKSRCPEQNSNKTFNLLCLVCFPYRFFLFSVAGFRLILSKAFTPACFPELVHVDPGSA